jgi:hypothetical protein
MLRILSHRRARGAAVGRCGHGGNGLSGSTVSAQARTGSAILDAILQISLFVKLKLAICARAGNLAGLF